jgi:hypothetical protein
MLVVELRAERLGLREGGFIDGNKGVWWGLESGVIRVDMLAGCTTGC